MRTTLTIVERITAETPGNLSALGKEDIGATPGVNLDDRLRGVPGFSLFRRSSSLVAHPTTQGVSLRGTGSSGASRTLVLSDGIPMNDPFGGWVYWSRFAPEELERVEISRGASTSVFGDRALGGVIALFSRHPEAARVTGRYEGGSRSSHDVSASYMNLWRSLALTARGRGYTTDGYFIVPAEVRGTVDRPAGVRFVNSAAALDYFRAETRLSLKADILAEDRANGTALQRNSTGLGQVSLDFRTEAGGSAFSAQAFHTREQFHSVFSALAPDRNSERLTFRQTVPSEAAGGAFLWRRGMGRWSVLAGADLFRVEGYSRDALFPSGLRVGGGTLWQHGAFVQSEVRVGPASLMAGARHHFTGRGRRFFSPSAGLALGRGWLRGRASVYRSFRAPTLNELHREFRVGNAVTQANAWLRPERVVGVEAGLDMAGAASRLRLTAFRSDLRDLITNVTLSVSPNLIVRQRQNAAAALSRGVEVEGLRRFGRWRAEAAYLFADSRFSGGERVPQVARHQGSGQVVYDRGGTLVSAGVRSYADQFEDELNRFRLPGFATVQVLARQRLARGFSMLAAVENLLDREYLTGFSPAPAIGAPRLWRLGLRWESAGP